MFLRNLGTAMTLVDASTLSRSQLFPSLYEQIFDCEILTRGLNAYDGIVRRRTQ